jgi:hypothetical protein
MSHIFPSGIMVVLAPAFVSTLLVYAWTPLLVKPDRLVFLPGSQPGSVNLEAATRGDNCHGGCNKAVEPVHNWRGGMMSQAARAPRWDADPEHQWCYSRCHETNHTMRATVAGASHTDSSLTPGSTYCDAVAADRDSGGAVGESGFSAVVCAVPTR